MNSTRLFVVLLIVLLGLLTYFTYPLPRHLIFIGVLVSAVGVLWLVLANRTKSHSWKELLRDIGVACIVAVIVTLIYEAGTRSVERRETVLKGIGTAMADFIGDNGWTDVQQEVLRGKRIRRNVDIEFKISRNARLSTGKYITAPPGQVILWMKYKYDLYAIDSAATSEPVEHQLGYEMWNPDLEIPRFEKVTLIRNNGEKEDPWEGERLARICTGGSVVLRPDILKLPPPRMNKPVTIVSERYELMSAPGSYNLVMPELTVRPDGSSEPTIKVAVTLPPDLEFHLDTYYAAHKFNPAGNSNNLWVYDNLMLPGQGFSLILEPKPRASIGAPVTTQ
jgi:hypothetical protein